jgi:hypothetical protein
MPRIAKYAIVVVGLLAGLSGTIAEAASPDT